MLFCLDAATGAEVFTERIGNSIWATPIALGGRLLLLGSDGMIRSFAAGVGYADAAEFNLFADDAAAAESAATLYAAVVVNDAILVRAGTKLYRLGGADAAE